MIFQLESDETWKIRGWVIGYRNKGEVLSYRVPQTYIVPQWYGAKAKVICPSMMEGWSNKLLTARQV